MKKINESQLIEQARSLRAYLSDAAVTSTDGTPVTSGDGTLQAGKGTPATAPAPAATTGEDPASVIAKYTDHPELPAYIDSKDGQVKWIDNDTKQPRVMPTSWIQKYAPDLAKAISAQGQGGQNYGAAQQGNFLGFKYDNGTKVNTAQATGDVAANKDIAQAKADTEQLKQLVAKLQAMNGGPAPAQGAKTPAAPQAAVPGVTADGKVIDTRGGIAGKDEMEESTTYFLNKLRMMEADAAHPGNPTDWANGINPPVDWVKDPATGKYSAPAAAPGTNTSFSDREALVKQITDLQGKITQAYGGETVPPEVSAVYDDAAKALQQAQTVSNQATAAPPSEVSTAQGAKTPEAPKAWAKGVLGAGSKGPEVNALQKQLGVPETGVFDAATKAAVIKKQTELKVKPDGAWGPASQAAMSAAAKASAPAANQGGKPVVKQEAEPEFSMPLESVTYGEDQSLARIIQLARK